ncbi:simple sugar transport system ATP-binding protein [Glaciihabitans sp. GrIS 2.15]|nr:simple sugar transport system ATP-binding protein [Glaciihabitans sp. GrIS 2.15]
MWGALSSSWLRPTPTIREEDRLDTGLVAKTESSPGQVVPLLEARSLGKTFGHVEALIGANFQVLPGEVVALIGDNGAGKSTLVKLLSGAIQPDRGSLLVDGVEVTFAEPADAQRQGIEVVYQDLALAPDLGPASNLFLGRELSRPGILGKLGFLDKRGMRDSAVRTLSDLGVDLRDVNAPVANLSGGQRQSVAICRAVMWARRVVFMDEPTAALGVVQTARVLDLIRKVRDSGVAVVLVSHNMPQVIEVADRIEVLRLGRRTARFSAAEVTVDDLVAAMTGALTQEEAER